MRADRQTRLEITFWDNWFQSRRPFINLLYIIVDIGSREMLSSGVYGIEARRPTWEAQYARSEYAGNKHLKCDMVYVVDCLRY